MSYLHICETSTATVPNTIATAASIGADTNGRAVQVLPPVCLSLGAFSTSLVFVTGYRHSGWLQRSHLCHRRLGITEMSGQCVSRT